MNRSKNKQPKLHIRKGDNVKVIAGNDKGKTGKVLNIITDKRRAVVEGINIVTKHSKPSAENPEGGINKVEAAVHISNLMVIDSSTGEPTKVGRKKDDDGSLYRYSKKTGEPLRHE
ncbi:MAG: 50S ribosomal protein L24 [Bacteroidota bacterium]